MPKRIVYPIGFNFPESRLTITENLPSRNGRSIVKCRCDCGGEWTGNVASVKYGLTRSCGCLRAETSRKTAKNNVTHGKTKHHLYRIWKQMVRRCTALSDNNYKYYGGRNINVCDEWKDKPALFIEWACKNGWEPGLQIDRIDNNGNYEPGNCRFVTSKENSRNTRRNTILTINGHTACIAEHAERAGLPYKIVSNRYRRGWENSDLLIPIGQSIRAIRDSLIGHRVKHAGFI